tara:strand:- start:151 stop:1305 length:1155 start_codon:yes stop_codon:yes gene_type:complete
MAGLREFFEAEQKRKRKLFKGEGYPESAAARAKDKAEAKALEIARAKARADRDKTRAAKKKATTAKKVAKKKATITTTADTPGGNAKAKGRSPVVDSRTAQGRRDNARAQRLAKKKATTASENLRFDPRRRAMRKQAIADNEARIKKGKPVQGGVVKNKTTTSARTSVLKQPQRVADKTSRTSPLRDTVSRVIAAGKQKLADTGRPELGDDLTLRGRLTAPQRMAAKAAAETAVERSAGRNFVSAPQRLAAEAAAKTAVGRSAASRARQLQNEANKKVAAARIQAGRQKLADAGTASNQRVAVERPAGRSFMSPPERMAAETAVDAAKARRLRANAAFEKIKAQRIRAGRGYKKGGVVKAAKNTSSKKSIDGIARKGKTRAKHR